MQMGTLVVIQGGLGTPEVIAIAVILVLLLFLASRIRDRELRFDRVSAPGQ
jgi:hypothetical protein